MPDLTLRAQIKPDDRQEVALTGDFSVGNGIAGPLDRQRLPLESMSGRFDLGRRRHPHFRPQGRPAGSGAA